jgi:hypothetical protein
MSYSKLFCLMARLVLRKLKKLQLEFLVKWWFYSIRTCISFVRQFLLQTHSIKFRWNMFNNFLDDTWKCRGTWFLLHALALCKQQIKLYRFLWTNKVFSFHSKLKKCPMILLRFCTSSRSVTLKVDRFVLISSLHTTKQTQFSGLRIDLTYTKNRPGSSPSHPSPKCPCWMQIDGITHVRRDRDFKRRSRITLHIT